MLKQLLEDLKKLRFLLKFSINDEGDDPEPILIFSEEIKVSESNSLNNDAK
jgi:hypothetical protein